MIIIYVFNMMYKVFKNQTDKYYNFLSFLKLHTYKIIFIPEFH